MTATTAVAFKGSLPQLNRHHLRVVKPLGKTYGPVPEVFLETVCIGNLVYIRDNVRHLQMVDMNGGPVIFPNSSESTVFEWLDDVCRDNMKEIADFFLGKSNASRYIVVVKKELRADGRLTFTFTIQYLRHPPTH